MFDRRMCLAALAATCALALPLVARAELAVVRGQFTDRVENRLPVGPPATLSGVRLGVYWIEVRNTGEPTTVTLEWSINGRVARRQSLEIRHGQRFRTWAMHRVRGAREVSVRLLDASGTQIHTDSVTLGAAP